MARNEKIEAILEAWWNFVHAPRNEKRAAEKVLNDCLDAVIGDQPFTRAQVLDHLHGHFLEYRKARLAREKLQTARSALSKPD